MIHHITLSHRGQSGHLHGFNELRTVHVELGFHAAKKRYYVEVTSRKYPGEESLTNYWQQNARLYMPSLWMAILLCEELPTVTENGEAPSIKLHVTPEQKKFTIDYFKKDGAMDEDENF